jgi:hypothetical protein
MDRFLESRPRQFREHFGDARFLKGNVFDASSFGATARSEPAKPQSLSKSSAFAGGQDTRVTSLTRLL